MTKTKLFVEAGSIAEKNMSGVGHTALSLVKGLARNDEFTARYDIVLIVAFNKVELARSHNLPDSISFRKIYLPGRIMNGLSRFNLLPFMDIFLGKGVYLFPNFKNWPLLFSHNITYIHDVYFKVAPEHIEPRNLDLLNRQTERFISRATKVVTVSQHAKREIEHFFANATGKTEVVYNGVEHELYYPRPRIEQEGVAKKYNLIPRRYFVFFSNIEPRKNIETLLDAYKLFVDETKARDVGLILVGGMGWSNETALLKLKKLQDAGYNVVKPNSYVPDSDMPAMLTGAIALVHPALYEGFGLTPLEAMACGTPVVVGNNSSLPEVMGEAYDEYIDIYDPKEIKNAMVAHYTTRSENTYGIKRAAGFSWSESSTALTKIIEEVSNE